MNDNENKKEQRIDGGRHALAIAVGTILHTVFKVVGKVLDVVLFRNAKEAEEFKQNIQKESDMVQKAKREKAEREQQKKEEKEMQEQKKNMKKDIENYISYIIGREDVKNILKNMGLEIYSDNRYDQIMFRDISNTNNKNFYAMYKTDFMIGNSDILANIIHKYDKDSSEFGKLQSSIKASLIMGYIKSLEMISNPEKDVMVASASTIVNSMPFKIDVFQSTENSNELMIKINNHDYIINKNDLHTKAALNSLIKLIEKDATKEISKPIVIGDETKSKTSKLIIEKNINGDACIRIQTGTCKDGVLQETNFGDFNFENKEDIKRLYSELQKNKIQICNNGERLNNKTVTFIVANIGNAKAPLYNAGEKNVTDVITDKTLKSGNKYFTKNITKNGYDIAINTPKIHFKERRNSLFVRNFSKNGEDITEILEKEKIKISDPETLKSSLDKGGVVAVKNLEGKQMLLFKNSQETIQVAVLNRSWEWTLSRMKQYDVGLELTNTAEVTNRLSTNKELSDIFKDIRPGVSVMLKDANVRVVILTKDTDGVPLVTSPLREKTVEYEQKIVFNSQNIDWGNQESIKKAVRCINEAYNLDAYIYGGKIPTKFIENDIKEFEKLYRFDPQVAAEIINQSEIERNIFDEPEQSVNEDVQDQEQVEERASETKKEENEYER